MSIRDYVFPYEAKNFPSFSIIFWISPCLYSLGFSGSCKLILRTSSEWLSAYSWQVRQPLKKNSFEKNTFEKWFRLLGRRRRQVSKFAVSPNIIKIRVCTNFLKVQTTEIYKNSAISGKNSIQRWLPFILIISFITPYPHPVQHRCESFTIRRPPSLDRPKRLRSCQPAGGTSSAPFIPSVVFGQLERRGASKKSATSRRQHPLSALAQNPTPVPYIPVVSWVRGVEVVGEASTA